MEGLPSTQTTIKDPHRYAVHECDATMLIRAFMPGTKKLKNVLKNVMQFFWKSLLIAVATPAL